jgi:hypothetical protein
MRAGEVWKALAEAPIVATADPLPAAFSATLGRFLALGGLDAVALLLTGVLELVSGFGLAGLTALYGARDQSSGNLEGGSPISPASDCAAHLLTGVVDGRALNIRPVRFCVPSIGDPGLVADTVAPFLDLLAILRGN